MRIAILALVAPLALALAAPVDARVPHRRECHKLTQQIARYERDLGWALERDNELWAQANVRQIAHLEDRRDRLCPHLRQPGFAERVGGAVVSALLLAGKVAKTAFTLGLL
ncbi:MAG: hypothetical protein R3244_00725 [Thermoanaerobaculia bacterium]|nr:hypothetical protein [Thermoanaerobaculia bacterium]